MPSAVPARGPWKTARVSTFEIVHSPTTTSTRKVVVAAGSSALQPILDGPVRAGVLLGTVPHAWYVDVAPEVIAVVTRDGLRLPNALVLPGSRGQRPLPALPAGSVVAVGAGGVAAGPWAIRVVRWWAPRVPAPPEPALLGRRAARFAAALDASGSRLADPVATGLVDLAAAVAGPDPAALRGHVRRLVGLGPGLTPAGDDVLVGLVLALRHLGGTRWRRTVAALGQAIAEVAGSATTALSASLLRHAAAGRAVDQAVDALDALGGRLPLPEALQRLLAVGHSSGHDMARGLAAGARIVASGGGRAG